MAFVFKHIIPNTTVDINGRYALKQLYPATIFDSPDNIFINLTSLGLEPGEVYTISVVAKATGIENSDHSKTVGYRNS